MIVKIYIISMNKLVGNDSSLLANNQSEWIQLPPLQPFASKDGNYNDFIKEIQTENEAKMTYLWYKIEINILQYGRKAIPCLSYRQNKIYAVFKVI